MLFYSPIPSSWSSTEDVIAYLGEPKTYNVSLVALGDAVPITPHTPKYWVIAPNHSFLIHSCMSSFSSIHMKISDFGESFVYDGRPVLRRPNMALEFRAPELFFGESLTPAGDVWAFSVLMHMILGTDGSPFWFVRDPLRRSEEHPLGTLIEMVRCFGKFPERWWSNWAERPAYFDEDGKWIGDSTLLMLSTPHMFTLKESSALSKKDVMTAERIMLSIMQYEPTERPSAWDVALAIPASWMEGTSYE